MGAWRKTSWNGTMMTRAPGEGHPPLTHPPLPPFPTRVLYIHLRRRPERLALGRKAKKVRCPLVVRRRRFETWNQGEREMINSRDWARDGRGGTVPWKRFFDFDPTNDRPSLVPGAHHGRTTDKLTRPPRHANLPLLRKWRLRPCHVIRTIASKNKQNKQVICPVLFFLSFFFPVVNGFLFNLGTFLCAAPQWK
jgi:hypothetical protein